MPDIRRNRRRRRLAAFFAAAGHFFFLVHLWMDQLWRFVGRRWWTHPFLKERWQIGAFVTVFQKFKNESHENFFKLTRMSVELFEELLLMVSPDLQRDSYREYLTPEFRLAFTLWYELDFLFKATEICSLPV